MQVQNLKPLNLKGIILAGGSGTRLYPITKGISKQLLPIYDKPMIYYPLSVLMIAGIRDILIITTPEDQQNFKNLLGDGSNFGINLSYKIQPSPDGLAQAFILGEEFIKDSSVCLILGDNIFYGHNFVKFLNSAKQNLQNNNASVFGYYVNDPERYGVVEFDEHNNAISIEEKPSIPKSNYAVAGLYFYPNDVIAKAKATTPSARGELEITSINQSYLEQNRLCVELMGRGYAWLDTGTMDSLLEASQFIQTIQNRQSLKVACLEEIAFESGWIDRQKLLELGKALAKNQYGEYLLKIANNGGALRLKN